MFWDCHWFCSFCRRSFVAAGQVAHKDLKPWTAFDSSAAFFEVLRYGSFAQTQVQSSKLDDKQPVLNGCGQSAGKHEK